MSPVSSVVESPFALSHVHRLQYRGQPAPDGRRYLLQVLEPVSVHSLKRLKQKTWSEYRGRHFDAHGRFPDQRAAVCRHVPHSHTRGPASAGIDRLRLLAADGAGRHGRSCCSWALSPWSTITRPRRPKRSRPTICKSRFTNSPPKSSSSSRTRPCPPWS